MAYPTVSAPYGFKPLNRFDGIPYAGATLQLPVTSGVAVYNGQVVQQVAGGTVSPIADLTAESIYAVGVCVGVQYTNSLGQTVQAQYAPASGVTNVIAYVVVDPAALFKVAVTTSTPGTMSTVTAAVVGSNILGVTGTGNANTGDINSSVYGASAAATATHLFRVVAVVPETAASATTYTEVIVKFNGTWHQMLSTTGTALS
jgi:hypothetical protein